MALQYRDSILHLHLFLTCWSFLESLTSIVFHDLLNCVSSHLVHLEPQQRGYGRSNIQIGNVIEVDAPRNTGAPSDENSLHLVISIEVAVGAPDGHLGDKVSFRLVAKHIVGRSGKHKIGRLIT